MTDDNVTYKFAGTVKRQEGSSSRQLYPHQIEAISCLDKLDKNQSFSTILVLPTGAGKTMTASRWLLRSAIDQSKKILWIAHRHLLLEQAAEAFIQNAYSDVLVRQTSFQYRIVSGQHDRPIHIKTSDDLLIISKDSLYKNLDILSKWLANQEEIYFVIDEAHHATAWSYRQIIEYVNKRVKNVKLLGLTATPFRTSEQEKGLLGKIFTDDIAYKVDLDTLIKREILSTPICESVDTKVLMGSSLGVNAIQSIERLDVIPDAIADAMAQNADRNRAIVNTFYRDKGFQKYGQTLVFALNRVHAFALRKLFEIQGVKYGIRAGVIVSGTTAEFTGANISDEENRRQIEEYQSGKLQVLINVNILTEGIDLPKTKTVFLTRPTVSSVLMTQMIGRALRGVKAGGTKEAYIVSFIDEWNNKIAWVNPETIITTDMDFPETQHKKRDYVIRLISIEKIEEFARILDESVDTSKLESIDYICRIPLGMYVFSFIDENSLEQNCQILVYDNSMSAYKALIQSLAAIFEEYKIEDDILPKDLLETVTIHCEESYFTFDMTPPYNPRDIRNLIRFYAQKRIEPLFLALDEADRTKLDISYIAKKIIDEDMRDSEQDKFIDELWNDESNCLKVYFGNKLLMKRQIQTEKEKIKGNFTYVSPNSPVWEQPLIETLTLHEIKKRNPAKFYEIHDTVYDAAKAPDGEYQCAICGKKSSMKGLFQIDHITPMAKGGLSKLDNLQLLCISCNRRKGDH